MFRLRKTKINIRFLVNPFFLFIIAFGLALLLYIWDWSDLYPALSAGLLIFLLISFSLFFAAGRIFSTLKPLVTYYWPVPILLNDIIFYMIIFLGILNVLLTGYLPFLDKTHDYREFGAPVIDVLFNTLSIFFSVVFYRSFIEERKKRYLIYVIVILIVQILLYRRSTIVWILCSSFFLYVLRRQTIYSWIIILGFLLIPMVSYCFGLYGTIRSDFTRTYILDELGASESFKCLNISPNHYMTYLYVSSPLANLQENIGTDDKFIKDSHLKNFIFYSLIPPSFTMRLMNKLNLNITERKLIYPDLIAGSCFMLSYCTMGWAGMIIMALFILLYITVCQMLLRKWNTFYLITISLLSTASSLMIFDNFFIRLDVILLLFVYPIVFHFIYHTQSLKKSLQTG